MCGIELTYDREDHTATKDMNPYTIKAKDDIDDASVTEEDDGMKALPQADEKGNLEKAPKVSFRPSKLVHDCCTFTHTVLYSSNRPRKTDPSFSQDSSASSTCTLCHS